jgi:hypothetical protein
MNRFVSRVLLPLALTACTTTTSLAGLLTGPTTVQAAGLNTSVDSNAVYALQSTTQLSTLAPQNDSLADDAPVVQTQGDGPLPSKTDQMWRFVAQPGTSPTYELMNVGTDKCLSVYYNSLAVGGKLVQYACHAWADQLWSLKQLPANSYLINGVQLQSLSSGLWLSGPTEYPDARSAAMAGVPLSSGQLSLDIATNALAIYPKQIFSVAPGQKYRLTTANSLALDVAPGTDDAKVVQSAVNLGRDQGWLFDPQPDGSYAVINGHTGLCLSVYYASTAAGAGLVQYTCHGRTDQSWDIIPIANPFSLGYSLELRSRLSGMAVDVPGDTIIQGTQFDQWPASGAINQRFVVTAS